MVRKLFFICRIHVSRAASFVESVFEIRMHNQQSTIYIEWKNNTTMYRLVNPNAMTNPSQLDCQLFRNPLVRNPIGTRVSPDHVFPPVKIQFHHFQILQLCRPPALHCVRYSVQMVLPASLNPSALWSVFHGSCIGMVSLVQLALSMAIHFDAVHVHWFCSVLSLHGFLLYYYCRSYPVFVLSPFQLMAGRISHRHLKQSTRLECIHNGVMACVRRSNGQSFAAI